MKKIITTVSAMTLTLPSGASKAADIYVESFHHDDIRIMYAEGENFKGSGFVDLDVQKTVILSNDVDSSGDVTLGDQLTYSVQITNLDQVAVPDVVMLDFLDSKIDLNLGTVAITQGLVLSGNSSSDSTGFLQVNLGAIAPNWFALIDFDVTVTDLDPGLNVVENTAEVFGPSGSFFLSDDPTTPEFDPTRIDAYGAFPDLIFENGFDFSGSGGF